MPSADQLVKKWKDKGGLACCLKHAQYQWIEANNSLLTLIWVLSLPPDDFEHEYHNLLPKHLQLR